MSLNNSAPRPGRVEADDSLSAAEWNKLALWLERHEDVDSEDIVAESTAGGRMFKLSQNLKLALNRARSAVTAHPWNVKTTVVVGALVVVVNGRDGYAAKVNSVDAQIGGVFCVPRTATAPVPYLVPTGDGGIYVKVTCDVEGTMTGYPQVEFVAGFDAPASTETVGYLQVALILDYLAGVFRVVKNRQTGVGWRKCGFDSHVWGADG
jgi:hypothetical protein